MSEQRKSPTRESPRQRPEPRYDDADVARRKEPADGHNWRGEGVVGDRHTD